MNAATEVKEAPRPTTPELAAEVGITYRQMDYWIRQGYIGGGCPGSGNARDLPDFEVSVLRHMALLVHIGLPAATAAEAARFLAMGLPWQLGPWSLTPPSDAAIDTSLEQFLEGSLPDASE